MGDPLRYQTAEECATEISFFRVMDGEEVEINSFAKKYLVLLREFGDKLEQAGFSCGDEQVSLGSVVIGSQLTAVHCEWDSNDRRIKYWVANLEDTDSESSDTEDLEVEIEKLEDEILTTKNFIDDTEKEEASHRVKSSPALDGGPVRAIVNPGAYCMEGITPLVDDFEVKAENVEGELKNSGEIMKSFEFWKARPEADEPLWEKCKDITQEGLEEFVQVKQESKPLKAEMGKEDIKAMKFMVANKRFEEVAGTAIDLVMEATDAVIAVYEENVDSKYRVAVARLVMKVCKESMYRIEGVMNVVGQMLFQE